MLKIYWFIFPAILMLSGCFSKNISPEEKELLVTELAFHDYGFIFSDTPSGEFKKTQYLDGSSEIEYAFEGFTEDSTYLYLSNTISTEQNENEASKTYLAEGLITKIGKVIHSEFKPVEGFSYGDQSNLYLWYIDGQPYGNVCRYRNSNKCFFLIVAGLYFDTPEDWQLFFDENIKKR